MNIQKPEIHGSQPTWALTASQPLIRHPHVTNEETEARDNKFFIQNNTDLGFENNPGGVYGGQLEKKLRYYTKM